MGILAEQLMNGMRRIVTIRSRSDGSVRLAMTPGTVQPNPTSMGTMLRPDRPIFLRSLSMTNATRAMYPESSSRARKKNSVTMMGTKLTTVPTPAKTPSMMREWITSLTLAAASA